MCRQRYEREKKNLRKFGIKTIISAASDCRSDNITHLQISEEYAVSCPIDLSKQ